uniref:Uncharacterized protein n=1 Tax=Cacopsylla melanoneura TaxID=428564 RepID=A0A8D8TNE3_9HEMI
MVTMKRVRETEIAARAMMKSLVSWAMDIQIVIVMHEEIIMDPRKIVQTMNDENQEIIMNLKIIRDLNEEIIIRDRYRMIIEIVMGSQRRKKEIMEIQTREIETVINHPETEIAMEI